MFWYAEEGQVVGGWLEGRAWWHVLDCWHGPARMAELCRPDLLHVFAC